MPAAKDSKPATSMKKDTTTGGEESVTPAPQPSGLGELANAAIAPASRVQGAVQRVQVSSPVGADASEEPRDGVNKGLRLHPPLDPKGTPWNYGLK